MLSSYSRIVLVVVSRWLEASSQPDHTFSKRRPFTDQCTARNNVHATAAMTADAIAHGNFVLTVTPRAQK